MTTVRDPRSFSAVNWAMASTIACASLASQDVEAYNFNYRGSGSNSAVMFLSYDHVETSSSVHRTILLPNDVPKEDSAPVLSDLQKGLNVGNAQLARILKVSRRTIYDWIDGSEPSLEHIEKFSRLDRVIKFLSRSDVSIGKSDAESFVYKGMPLSEVIESDAHLELAASALVAHVSKQAKHRDLVKNKPISERVKVGRIVRPD